MNGKAHTAPETYKSNRPSPSRTGRTRLVSGAAARNFDWSMCDATEIAHFVQVVVEHGDLACFTRTSDGGAICITVVCGVDRLKAYAANSNDLLLRMRDMLEELY